MTERMKHPNTLKPGMCRKDVLIRRYGMRTMARLVRIDRMTKKSARVIAEYVCERGLEGLGEWKSLATPFWVPLDHIFGVDATVAHLVEYKAKVEALSGMMYEFILKQKNDRLNLEAEQERKLTDLLSDGD